MRLSTAVGSAAALVPRPEAITAVRPPPQANASSVLALRFDAERGEWGAANGASSQLEV